METLSDRGLCQDCWKDTHFATGQVCDSCGVPVHESMVEPCYCDQCLGQPPAWDQGRCSVLYEGVGRKMALLLKHSDRLDLVPEMAKWMHQSCNAILQPDMIIAPVPLHRWRLLRRQFNQAAVLAQSMARIDQSEVWVDLLHRIKPTEMQKGKGRAARFTNLSRSIILNEAYRDQLQGRSVLLVDDVMTTGATLSACAEACRQAGAKKVNAAVFARVARLE
ncbi:MAG: ComF family protein [Amylibacter sp.]|nr:ComF family protein [Amylibacter sp.]